ncbi:hypothetical protein NX773_15660 [Massilia solisilvae]|uniref:Uncharacterized protein n=1 Tax=Massilia solisilvae TaxID=1811225 RepID=A0ABT2BM75_9BURK|nr:hypothetical protein [Massilia solisilvae]MCS0609604.1 hypothetical protein [Massilia solisilvae]
MFGLLKRAAVHVPGPGSGFVAVRATGRVAVAHGCGAVIVDGAGRTRRQAGAGRVAAAEGEVAWLYHPGPYQADLTPFAAAPEIGLRVDFAVDSPDPRLRQQRFDLYLASEAAERVELAALAGAMESALQAELARGHLELPPCATLDEWNAFRAGFNQLMYTRFGVSVDDCVPVDLAASRDYGRMLAERETAAVAPNSAAVEVVAEQAFDAAATDARVLRRLFLELPWLMGELRQAPLPTGPGEYVRQRVLLHRLDLASLCAATMPALELAGPGQPLAAIEQMRRARHSQQAAHALDEAWALLARTERADAHSADTRLDELDRIVANLEYHCTGRRAVRAGAPA